MVIEPLKSDERIDLFEYMINEDKPNGEDNGYWWAGQQISALKYYLDDSIQFILEFEEDDYQGNCYVLFKIKDNYVLWRDYFGSCGGCDALEEENGYEYIKETLSEGNTHQFKSIADVKQFVIEDREGQKWSEWRELPLEIFDNLEN